MWYCTLFKMFDKLTWLTTQTQSLCKTKWRNSNQMTVTLYQFFDWSFLERDFASFGLASIVIFIYSIISVYIYNLFKGIICNLVSTQADSHQNIHFLIIFMMLRFCLCWAEFSWCLQDFTSLSFFNNLWGLEVPCTHCDSSPAVLHMEH